MTVCLMWPYFNDLRWKVKWDGFDCSQNLIRYIFINLERKLNTPTFVTSTKMWTYDWPILVVFDHILPQTYWK
jgi:hypothetical protein